MCVFCPDFDRKLVTDGYRGRGREKGVDCVPTPSVLQHRCPPTHFQKHFAPMQPPAASPLTVLLTLTSLPGQETRRNNNKKKVEELYILYHNLYGYPVHPDLGGFRQDLSEVEFYLSDNFAERLNQTHKYNPGFVTATLISLLAFQNFNEFTDYATVVSIIMAYHSKSRAPSTMCETTFRMFHDSQQYDEHYGHTEDQYNSRRDHEHAVDGVRVLCMANIGWKPRQSVSSSCKRDSSIEERQQQSSQQQSKVDIFCASRFICCSPVERKLDAPTD